jgi:hypothetical protein
VLKIATEYKTDKENIEEIVSDTEPMESKNDDYDDSDHHYKRRNPKASDDILKFV